jgi:hypothetical protein
VHKYHLANFINQSIVGWQIVTADGRIRYVNATQDPELAVALRGSGSQFGETSNSVTLDGANEYARHCDPIYSPGISH